MDPPSCPRLQALGWAAQLHATIHELVNIEKASHVRVQQHKKRPAMSTSLPQETLGETAQEVTLRVELLQPNTQPVTQPCPKPQPQ